jgi:hypothetical protein
VRLQLLAQVSQRVLSDPVLLEFVAELHGEAPYPGVLGEHLQHGPLAEIAP